MKSRPPHPDRRGFSLVATVSVLILLALLAAALLTLSTSTLRSDRREAAMSEARANARMALVLAIADLQKHLGPDQRVSARAAILETGATPLPHRNWLGAWKNTHAANGRQWPLVGKRPDTGATNEPYQYPALYEDLRVRLNAYKNNQWRSKLRQAWLVSQTSASTDLAAKLNADASDYDRPAAAEILGKGTLAGLPDKDYRKQRVLVEKIPVQKGGATTGKFAWWISENNQKALVLPGHDLAGNDEKRLLASQNDNPAALQAAGVADPYAAFPDAASPALLATRQTAAFASADPATARRALGQHFHHLTHHAHGLFADPVLGALKKDLAPVLFGRKSDPTLTLPRPAGNTQAAPADFSSAQPIIPGHRHAMIGPSFDALRHWGLSKYTSGLAAGKIAAQLDFPADATRYFPSSGSWSWDRVLASGTTFESTKWAAKRPKLYPVMTDARWHFYFSCHRSPGYSSLRTHIIPRVCLWNPYSIEMKVPRLVVLMANPYSDRDCKFDLFFDAAEATRMKKIPKYENHPSSTHPVKKWVSPYKAQLITNSRNGKDGLFPKGQYLGFLLEQTTFAPGECLVFSPKVTNGISSQDYRIAKYDHSNISKNLLGADSPQGENHFYHNFTNNYIKLQGRNPSGAPHWYVGSDSIASQVYQDLDFSRVWKYESWAVFYDNFGFVLKKPDATTSTTADAIATRSSKNYPTLQFINGGNGGESTYDFWQYTWWWQDSHQASGGQFGHLQDWKDNPLKEAPALHQTGTKLLWLDESATEGNAPPLRVKLWPGSSHIAFHPVSVAHWNVRPQLVTRSPASPCAYEWYSNSSGAWMQQFSPLSPRDNNDTTSFPNSRGLYPKNPFGSAIDFPDATQAPFFDLPHPEYGALSLGSLRHASLSPYSWSPTYVIGHGRQGHHSPTTHSAHLSLAKRYTGSPAPTYWDNAIGAQFPYSLSWGVRSWNLRSGSTLQIGSHAPNSLTIAGKKKYPKTQGNEILAHDIAFETNQNLWDHYFISGIPLEASGSSFSWDDPKDSALWNQRYGWSHSSSLSAAAHAAKIKNPSTGLAHGFWNNAHALRNKAAFNVNSTSVPAWTAFLSGLRGIDRPALSGTAAAGSDTIFSRVRKPLSAPLTQDIKAVTHPGAWAGARRLTDAEIAALAEKIVAEVKARGPFLSLADFVNRRLDASSNAHSWKSALEAAIDNSGLNAPFERENRFLAQANNANDANHPEWKINHTLHKQHLKSKAWGIPGYLTQHDLLEPLAPALAVRGDSFTVRACGEARGADGRTYRAWLEATVARSPEYLDPAANHATDPLHTVHPATGKITENPKISPLNKTFGRRFHIQSLRWLSSEEI